MKKQQRKYLIIASVWILFLSFNTSAQSFGFRHFDKSTGLTNSFVYNVNQDKRGFLWLGTGSGLFRFDGISFVASQTNGYEITMVTKLFSDKKKNLWIGHDHGLISVFDGYSFFLLNKENESQSDIKAICETEEEILLFAQNGTYFSYDSEYQPTVRNEIKDKLTLMCAHAINHEWFLLGTEDGLYLYNYKNKKLSQNFKFSQIPTSNISSIHASSDSNSYWISTKDEGFYLLSMDTQKPDSYTVSMPDENFKLELWNIDYIFEDDKRSVWVSTSDMGLYRFSYVPGTKKFKTYEHFSSVNGVLLNSIRCIYQDNYRNLWFGSFGEGIFSVFDDAFSFINVADHGFKSDVYSLSKGKKNIYAGGIGGFLIYNHDMKLIHAEKINELAEQEIVSILEGPDGTLYLGTKRLGLYSFKSDTKKLKQIHFSQNTLENYINKVIAVNGYLWIATNGGIIKYNLDDKSSILLSTNSGLPHNKINDIFKDSKGNIWIATKSNTLVSVNSDIRHEIRGNLNIEFNAIAEDASGNLWAATNGYGVFVFKNDTLLNYSVSQGLLSDYAYSIVEDIEGAIWVGHRQGVSKIIPLVEKILLFNQDLGIKADCLPNSIQGTFSSVLIGTNAGILYFDLPKMSAQSKPPIPQILSVKISDKEVFDFTSINLPYNKYSLRFNFIGLNYRQPGSIKYQYKLEGWDLNWSEITSDNHAMYPRVEDGQYVFVLRSFNAYGEASENEVRVEVLINRPFWKSWWFRLSVIVFVFLIFYFIVLYREKRQKEFQKYLQKLLDERTAEVVQQKQELEVINKDITDSINYARRIQSSMLPPQEILNKHFSQSFIINYPRDIVSGDFYWFNNYDDNFYMLCADSTGHGVPGAFMSIIGITLMKDITFMNPSQPPSVLLNHLDIELQNTINQNQINEKSMDGMDASFIQINLKDLKTKISSAMRPVFVIQNNELIAIEGSKSAIGSTPNLKIKKEFNEYDYELKKGDAIYLFTDGYTDQFGGPGGKKFKQNKFKALIHEIHRKPMNEQKEIIEETFRIWKGDHEQIDDVLVIGLRL